MKIVKADRQDLAQILELQYLCYQSEARLLNNFNIPPLKQTLSEVEEEHRTGVILKALDQTGRIIGSVRGVLQEGTLLVGKLFVHPDHQKQGIGTALLLEIEQHLPHDRCQLFTSTQSRDNIRLYQKAGYTIFQEKDVSPVLRFVYLEK